MVLLIPQSNYREIKIRWIVYLCFLITASLPLCAMGEVLVKEDFEDSNLKHRGWYDIAKWQKELFITDKYSKTGQKCLEIKYNVKSCGPWMHIKLKPQEEVYVRYYRLFPNNWQWPTIMGPHDTTLFAGSYTVPTNTDLSVILDFDRNADTMIRIATAKQKVGGYWGSLLRKLCGTYLKTPYNISAPEKVPKGKWHCVEYYARLSTPGKEDGICKLWVNGNLVSDCRNLPLRDENHAGIMFNHWMLGPYFHGESPQVQSSYIDALVISTDYVGTLEQNGNQSPLAYCDYQWDWGELKVHFDASRSYDPDGTIKSYCWDFADGNTGVGLVTTHRYEKPGQYNVTLTVTDNQSESDTIVNSLTVGKEIGCGTGLLGEYYDNDKLHGSEVRHIEPNIDFDCFDWKNRYIRAEVGGEYGDHYSARWTGFLQPQYSEDYTLYFEVDEGGRVYLDGKLIIDAWNDRKIGAIGFKTGRLIAGKKYPLEVEFYEKKGIAKARLLWESFSTRKEAVPPSQFYLPEGNYPGQYTIPGMAYNKLKFKVRRPLEPTEAQQPPKPPKLRISEPTHRGK